MTTEAEILEEIARLHGDHCRELGIKRTPVVRWDVRPKGPCFAFIYWRKGRRPERLVAQSWAELSFGVLLRWEDSL